MRKSESHKTSQQESLHEELAWLASFPEINPNPVFETTVDGVITYMNPSAKSLFPELQNEGAEHPLLKGFREATRALLEGKEAMLQREVRVGERTYEEHIYLVPESKALRFYVEDITEKREYRSKLEYLASYPEMNPSPIVEVDLEGKIHYLNSSAEKTFPTLREESFEHPFLRGIDRLGVVLSEAPEAPATREVEVQGVWYQQIIYFVPEVRRLRIYALDVTESYRAKQELEAIASVSRALQHTGKLAEILSLVLERISSLLGAGGSAIALRDPTTGELVISHSWGAWEAWKGKRLSSVSGITAEVVLSGESYGSADISSERDFPLGHLLGGLKAVACVRLTAEEQSMGAVWMGRATEFSSHEINLLQAMSDISASAIHRAMLQEMIERRMHRFETLRMVESAVTGSLDLQLTLSILLEVLTTELNADAGDVLLLNPHEQALVFGAARGFRYRDIERVRIRLGDGLAGTVALERRTMSCIDLTRGNAEEIHLKEGFASYCGVPLIAKGEIEGVLEVYHRTKFESDREWVEFLESIARGAAIAIDNARLYQNAQRSTAELTVSYDATLEGWVRALDLRDKETEGHTERVTEMTVKLSAEFGYEEDEIVHIRRGALLHDIGKIGIPDAILHKPGPLTEEEWEIMKRHPVYAFEMLKDIRYLKPALDIPYCHHERWDGSGYPRALRGEDIPHSARIFAVVDVWDALRFERPYHKAWDDKRVREHLRSLAGIHFDPEVVNKFLKMDWDTV